MIDRVKYILKRLHESPLPFLLLKAKVELNKRLFFSKKNFFFKYLVNKELVLLKKNPRKSLELQLLNEELEYLSSRVKSYNDGYPCLGYGNVDIMKKGAFSKDCVNGYKWDEKQSSFKIDFIKTDVSCDVKIPWEKSRLQWLTEMAVLCTNELHSIDELYNHLTRWERENPINHGVNWISSMEVAIRAINLAIVLLLIEKLNHKKLNSLLFKCIAEHKTYLILYPEISDIPGNHFLATEIGKATIMFLQGVNYCNKSFDALLEQQFPEGGIQIEYSTIYNRFCVDLAILGFCFIEDALSCDRLKSKFSKLCDSVSVISSSKSILPIFGDSDSGHVLNFGQSSRDASFYTKKIFSKNMPMRLYTSIIKKISSEVDKAICEYSPTISKNFTLYPFHIIENKTFKVITRFGRAGLSGRAPHDHDDVMSFWVFKNGEDMILERGCAPYTLNYSKRKKMISSESHNCLIFNCDAKNTFKIGSIFPTVLLNEVDHIDSKKNYIELKRGNHYRKISISEFAVKLIDSWNFNCKGKSYVYKMPDVDVNFNDSMGVNTYGTFSDIFFNDYGSFSTEIDVLISELKCQGSYQIEFS